MRWWKTFHEHLRKVSCCNDQIVLTSLLEKSFSFASQQKNIAKTIKNEIAEEEQTAHENGEISRAEGIQMKIVTTICIIFH